MEDRKNIVLSGLQTKSDLFVIICLLFALQGHYFHHIIILSTYSPCSSFILMETTFSLLSRYISRPFPWTFKRSSFRLEVWRKSRLFLEIYLPSLPIQMYGRKFKRNLTVTMTKESIINLEAHTRSIKSERRASKSFNFFNLLEFLCDITILPKVNYSL